MQLSTKIRRQNKIRCQLLILPIGRTVDEHRYREMDKSDNSKYIFTSETQTKDIPMTPTIVAAMECFAQGFNCAQAVFSTYAPLVGIKQDDALRIATGLEAGMGRLQQVCGAVTGAVMLIGCQHGMIQAGDTAAKETSYTLVRDFTQQFSQVHGAISCKELLGCDLKTEAGQRHYHDNELSFVVCVPCVRDACRILEEIIFNDHDSIKHERFT